MKISQITEGYTVLPPMSDEDKLRYGDREAEGLEGPFRMRNGKVVYYDKRAGKYYDPDSDMFISDEDYFAMDSYKSRAEESVDINEEWYDAYRDYKGMGYSDAQARAEADRAYPQPKPQPKPQRKPELIAMHFFNVPSNDEDTARMMGLKQTKSGKWYVGEYTTSKPSNVQGKLKAASDTFGEPKRWEPKKKADEAKKSPAGGPACWKGKKIHPTKPTKMKGGKRVNNCIDAGTNEEVELDEAVKTKVYKSGKYWLVDVTSSKIDYTDWGPSGRGFDSEKDAQEFAKHVQKSVKESAELSEGPLVLSNDSSLLRMLDTLLSDWKGKDHSDEEMAALLKALGYSMDKKGDRTVLVKEASCPACAGRGHKPAAGGMDRPCDACDGTGKEQLEEAPGAIRKGLAAVALIAGLWGVNNHMAQQAYDASPQLQKLTAYLEVAKEHNDQRMIKQLEQRIENHKIRIDIGKGEVIGKDGMPIDVVYDKKRGKEI